ncbi:hypothetical protein Q4577_18180 [Marinovum sp. 2_MG-2023]|uniref:hypothetical protein n=1 Tax=unclassified Marinovum TaxID=2647166 RepID=UPI0026E18ABB|nr:MULTISPECIES: hypothetical protein [unclassified Marinovum]MDO6731964.1 hypothetical protein [Marinovum sp. 2_MG-2023]MDO6781216.1 hypothetical protein [Marinovum sp. 1_MG-2023]
MFEVLMLLGLGMTTAGVVGLTGLDADQADDSETAANEMESSEMDLVTADGGANDLMTQVGLIRAEMDADLAATAQFSGTDVADVTEADLADSAEGSADWITPAILSDAAIGPTAIGPTAISTDFPDVPVFEDFLPGQDTFVLHLPESVDSDADMWIEPMGEDGADAAIMLDDATGVLLAAVVVGAYGALKPRDIKLEREV